jgi:methanogenic corrinoid protein MtbC1
MTTFRAAPALTSSCQRVFHTLAHKRPEQVKVLVGGAPVTQQHADDIGTMVGLISDHCRL